MLQHYQHLIQQHQLRADEAQLSACLELDALASQLNQQQSGFSLYLYGPVGRGKSMLMDMFYNHLTNRAKIRLHYHHFMRRVHQQLNRLQGESDPLETIAARWAQQYKVICLDEFIVEDIGDAMLLANLWSSLFRHGAILVTTSNTPPKELYRGGLARHRFEPFIQLLQQQCQIIDLDMGVDYRRLTASDTPYYKVAGTLESLRNTAESTFGPLESTASLSVMNRQIDCLWSNDNLAVFDFWSLCSGPRSHRDYMELADRFQALAIHCVPQFSLNPTVLAAQGIEDDTAREYQHQHYEHHPSHLDNEARRFIALVDECYDRGCLLIITADTGIDELYQAELLEFPFKRCASRLIEMQSW